MILFSEKTKQATGERRSLIFFENNKKFLV